MSIGEEAARLAEAVPQVAATTATFAGIDGERARLLDEAGQAVFASKATADWPAVGDTVWTTVDPDAVQVLPERRNATRADDVVAA